MRQMRRRGRRSISVRVSRSLRGVGSWCIRRGIEAIEFLVQARCPLLLAEKWGLLSGVPTKVSSSWTGERCRVNNVRGWSSHVSTRINFGDEATLPKVA